MTVMYNSAAAPVSEILHHHAVLRRGLEQRVGAVCAAAEQGAPHAQALAVLRDYLAGDIMPHAEAEERTLYRAAAATGDHGAQVARTLTAEHRDLAGLVGQLQSPADATAAATVAEWIATLFAGHAAKENDMLLPALIDAGTDLAALLADMHHLPAGPQA